MTLTRVIMIVKNTCVRTAMTFFTFSLTMGRFMWGKRFPILVWFHKPTKWDSEGENHMIWVRVGIFFGVITESSVVKRSKNTNPESSSFLPPADPFLKCFVSANIDVIRERERGKELKALCCWNLRWSWPFFNIMRDVFFCSNIQVVPTVGMKHQLSGSETCLVFMKFSLISVCLG